MDNIVDLIIKTKDKEFIKKVLDNEFIKRDLTDLQKNTIKELL